MTAAERPEDWLAAAAGSCVSFLSSYSSQLLTLSINLLPNLPSAVSLLQAAVRCGQLRRLELSGVYVETNSTEHRFDHNLVCPALCFTPLPQLHTLSLSHLHLSSEQLTALLQNCPLLEDATMTAMPGFSLDLLPVIGRCCRRLKQLALLDCDKAFFSQTVQGDASDGSSIVVFPHLVSLHAEVSGLCDCCKLPAPPLATLQWLRTVLQSTPVLQYLHFGCDESWEFLSALICLTRLRGLQVRGSVFSRRRRFFVQHHSSSYSSEQRRVDCWPPQSLLPEAEPELHRRLAWQFLQQGSMLKDREAFFAYDAAREAEEIAEEAKWDAEAEEQMQDEQEEVEEEEDEGYESDC